MTCMTKEERQKKIIAAVKKIVAEKGMDGFSIRQVADYTGINEALIYRDFMTKDHLLDICYKQVQDEVAEIYAGIGPFHLEDPQEAFLALKEMWMKSFRYLLDHKDNALFVRNYRESSYREKLLEAGRRREPKYFFDARDKFATALPTKIDLHCTWIYIIDLSLVFAAKILLGELPNTERSVLKVWKMMYTGASDKIVIKGEV